MTDMGLGPFKRVLLTEERKCSAEAACDRPFSSGMASSLVAGLKTLMASFVLLVDSNDARIGSRVVWELLEEGLRCRELEIERGRGPRGFLSKGVG